MSGSSKRAGATRIKRLRRNLQLTGPIVVLAVGVLVPVLLSTAVGILTLVLGDGSESIILGGLTISFTSAAIGGGIILAVLLGRRSRTARLQADFLANVTHELRTPLSSIRLYAQTLQSGLLNTDPARARCSVETIVRETEWLESMIDSVLTWRAAAKDRFDLDPEVGSVAPAVQAAVQRFGRMLTPGEVALTVDVQTAAPVRHDHRGLTILLINLLVNAYKYGGDRKRIRLWAEDRRDTVLIGVEDDGVGIPARELERIFDPFHRVETDRGPKTSGAGLGLAIVRHLADAHDGQVFVESTPGAGSRFVVQLPVATAPEPSIDEPAALETRDVPHTPEPDAELPEPDAELPEPDAELPEPDAEPPEPDAEPPELQRLPKTPAREAPP